MLQTSPCTENGKKILGVLYQSGDGARVHLDNDHVLHHHLLKKAEEGEKLIFRLYGGSVGALGREGLSRRPTGHGNVIDGRVSRRNI